MIAAIRVRFTPTPASAVWSDATFANWLDPAIPYSLAHFWDKSSFAMADLQFQIFPPVVMDDPRLALSAEDKKVNEKVRGALVNSAIAKVTDSFKPDWSRIDGILIWYAQPTDLFGGGAYEVPITLLDLGVLDDILGGPIVGSKYLPVCVSDIASTFDSACQELGHCYGFSHPLDSVGNDYGDPYDSMASVNYGGTYSSSFQRAADPLLPVGMDASGADPQLTVGPYVSAAQLSISPFGAPLKAAKMFVDVPPSYASGASSFTLHALDEAIANFPQQPLPILAVIPPSFAAGDQYYLELRRVAGYDSGLHPDAADTASPPHPPMGVVIHSYDRARNRIVYHDTFPLGNDRGDRDYHAFNGAFTFRVTNIGPDYRSVGITIGGADFWRNFGVNMDDVRHDVVRSTQTEWRHADVSPCFMFAPADYQYFLKYDSNRYTIVVSSFGYELPAYVWTVNGTLLDPSRPTANVWTNVELPGPTGSTVVPTAVTLRCTFGNDRLTLECDPMVGNFSLSVEVRSVETSPGVLKNLYEDKAQVTTLRFDNVKLVWDSAYAAAQKACEGAVDRVNEKHIPLRGVGVPHPEDPFDARAFEAVIDDLVESGVRFANAAARSVARVVSAVSEQFTRGR